MAAVTCALCGIEIEPGYGSCTHCGARVPVSPAEQRDPTAERPTTPTDPNGPPVAQDGGERPQAVDRPFGLDPFDRLIVPHLTVRVADGRSRVLLVERGIALVIGSDSGPAADLCTDNISRVHAEFRWDGTTLTVADVGSTGRGSTNGTFVNGIRLTPGVGASLDDGDVVACASSPALIISVEIRA